jgi:hypothetical protein
MLRPVIGLDMDRDQSIWKVFLNGFFDSVADVVGGIYAHATRHHQMEINEHYATGVPGAKVKYLDSTLCIDKKISRIRAKPQLVPDQSPLRPKADGFGWRVFAKRVIHLPM